MTILLDFPYVLYCLPTNCFVKSKILKFQKLCYEDNNEYIIYKYKYTNMLYNNNNK